MTNFEEWKENLTLEAFAKKVGNYCRFCPMEDACPCNEEMCSCKEAIMSWGEQEAQDESL
jgi:hypothetical protein